MPKPAATVADANPFKGNVFVLLHVQHIVQSICISCQHLNFDTKSCETPAKVIAGTRGSAIDIGGVKRRSHKQNSHEKGRDSIASSSSYRNLRASRGIEDSDYHGGTLLPRVALVTSGLGTKYGGIGVVAEMMVSALAPKAEVLVWQHPPFWPRTLRISAILWRASWGSLRHVDLVIYDHVHLAVLHHLIPWL